MATEAAYPTVLDAADGVIPVPPKVQAGYAARARAA